MSFSKILKSFFLRFAIKRPLRSSTETGVVTRLVSTRTTSSSAALAAASAAFSAARSFGDGGGGIFAGSDLDAPLRVAGRSFFSPGVLRLRVWANEVAARILRHSTQSV